MSDSRSNVGMAPQSGNVAFASYYSVVKVDPFVHPERLPNVRWLAPYYWRSSSLVANYGSAGMFPVRVPVRALALPQWDLRFIIPVRDLLRLRGASLQQARKELIVRQ